MRAASASKASTLRARRRSRATTGTPRQSGSWSFTVSLRNCTGGALDSVKLQGGTASWLSSATWATDPQAGTVTIKPNKNNAGQVVSWSGFSLPDGETGSVTVTVSGTVPKGAACGSQLPLTGVWTDSGRDATDTEISSGPSSVTKIEITC